MIIDQEAFNNSDFTLMAADEIASIADDKAVSKILKQYNITQDTNQLSDSQEILYLKLIQYVDNLYYLNQEIPEDIGVLMKNNGTFKSHLVQHINKRLKSLLTDGSAIFFKEIISIINLLSLGEKFLIFKTYNDYDFEAISKLFRLYESQLQELYDKDRFNFDTTFECYLTLIRAYSQLCIINATDVYRKKTINPIVNVITETINMLKFTVALEESYLSKLNNLLGEILYYFSHLPYIDAKGKELYYLIDEFFLLLEKQTDGYTLSKEANFGGNIDDKQEKFLIFLNNSGYLLLTMLQKLKYTFKDKDYFNTRSFQHCLRLFSENFPIMHVIEGEETLETFTTKLLNTIVQNYHFDEKDKTSRTISYHEVINDFIQTADNFNIRNIETIHNVLLFAEDIDDYKYLNIGETLLHSGLIKNDYYEFFKLKTIDIVINYFIKNKSKENIIPFIKHVEFYVDNNKQASHLLSMYSKLNLSMAHYYALIDEEEAVHKAKSLYSTFINTNGFKLLQNEYARINTDILSTLGKYYVKDLELNPERFSKERLIKLGKKLSQSYIEHLDLKLKYNINEEFSDILSNVLNKENLDYENINDQICDIIANKIFYGLCDVRIKGLTQKSAKIIDNGYMVYSMQMANEAYILQFIFPAVYEGEFKYILKQNKSFITKNVNNILSSFKRNSASHIDDTSGLQNIHKLKNDLLLYNDEEVVFIEILLGGLAVINKQYGLTMGNNFLRAICKKLSSIIHKEDLIYYLSGGKIGIIVASKHAYKSLIKSIEQIKIKKDGDNIDMKLTIAVTQSKASEVLAESSQLLDKALGSQSKILFNIK